MEGLHSSKSMGSKLNPKDVFYTAVKDGNIDQALMMLKENIIGVNNRYKFGDNEGCYALIVACEYGHCELVKFLLERGADISCQDVSGWFPLRKASNHNHYETVKLLLDYGAEVDQQDSHGWTALMNACRKGHYKVAKLLLKNDANPNILRKSGKSALMSASTNGRIETVKLLFEYKAQYDLKDDCGRTALMYACLSGNWELCRWLIARFEGALINMQDRKGHSALMLACKSDGHHEIVQLLLEKGARVDLLDEDGQSALYLAMINNRHKVVKLFLAPVHSKAKVRPTILGKVKKHMSTFMSVFSQRADQKNISTKVNSFDREFEGEEPSQNRLQRSWSLPATMSSSKGLIKAHHSPLTAPAIETYTTIESYTCDQLGDTLFIDDITVTIPPGAIPEGVTAHIEMGVALYGPFKFPDNHQPVSPILWFCIKENIELLQPLTYRLPHIIKDISGVEVTFAKANHSATNTDTFTFQTLECGQQNFAKDSPYGSLSTKDMCYLCIQAKITPDFALKKGYCLHAFIEEQRSSTYRIIFVCTYFLRTCFDALRELYPDNGSIEYKPKQEFHFKDLESCLIIEPIRKDDLDICFERDNKISASELDFWGRKFELDDMILRHKENMYPPKVSAVVYNSHEQRTASVVFEVQGTIETVKIGFTKPYSAAAVKKSSRLNHLDVHLKEESLNDHTIPYEVPEDQVTGDFIDAKPTLVALIRFHMVDGTVNLAENIGAKYHDFGVLLLEDNDGSTISAIELKQGGNPADINRRIFQLWLQGKGKQPKTWATLIAVLRDIEMNELAKNMEETLLP